MAETVPLALVGDETYPGFAPVDAFRGNTGERLAQTRVLAVGSNSRLFGTTGGRLGRDQQAMLHELYGSGRRLRLWLGRARPDHTHELSTNGEEFLRL